MINTPLSNRLLFWFYVLAILVVGMAALIWPAARAVAYAPLRDLLFPNVFLPSQASAPVMLSVAAPPALEGWLKANTARFTEENPFIQIDVTQLRGLDADNQLNTLTGQTDVWIAEADFARTAAGSIPYESQGSSVAQDSFLWVAVKSRQELSGRLNWSGVAQAAGGNPQFRIAMPPTQTIEGMAACWSAASEYPHSGNVTAAQINDTAFHAWLVRLLQAAPDRNRSPRDQLSARPPQGEAGLILKSDWSQLAQDAFITQPPDHNVIFNFPFYVRTSWPNLQPDEVKAHQDAANTFKQFLLSSAVQSQLGGYGLERAGSQPGSPLSQADEATLRALQFCW